MTVEPEGLVRKLFLAVVGHPKAPIIHTLHGAEYREVRDQIEVIIGRTLEDAERELGNGC